MAKNMTQREKREAAFLLLYQMQLNDDLPEEIIENNIAEFGMVTDKTILATVTGAAEHSAKADEIVTRYSKTRAVSRIPKISVAILRLALYEMDCLPETTLPDKVAINEAIELSKKYASEQDSVFVSGLLGSYYREKQSEKQADKHDE